MAKVILFADGFHHLEGHPVTTLDTLCGICDDKDNRPIGYKFEGPVTCPACRLVALAVFNDCKKSEVK